MLNSHAGLKKKKGMHWKILVFIDNGTSHRDAIGFTTLL